MFTLFIPETRFELLSNKSPQNILLHYCILYSNAFSLKCMVIQNIFEFLRYFHQIYFFFNRLDFEFLHKISILPNISLWYSDVCSFCACEDYLFLPLGLIAELCLTPPFTLSAIALCLPYLFHFSALAICQVAIKFMFNLAIDWIVCILMLISFNFNCIFYILNSESIDMSIHSVLVTGSSRGIGFGLVQKFLESDKVGLVIAASRPSATSVRFLHIHFRRALNNFRSFWQSKTKSFILSLWMSRTTIPSLRLLNK